MSAAVFVQVQVDAGTVGDAYGAGATILGQAGRVAVLIGLSQDFGIFCTVPAT